MKKKKFVQKNPDVIFSIFINDILLQYPSAIIEPQNSSNPNFRLNQSRYKVDVNYNLSIALQAVTREGLEHYIPLVSNEVYQKKFYVAIPHPDDITKKLYRPDVGTSIQRSVHRFNTNIPLFATDFNEALREYRKR